MAYIDVRSGNNYAREACLQAKVDRQLKDQAKDLERRILSGRTATWEIALLHCRNIVGDFLRSNYYRPETRFNYSNQLAMASNLLQGIKDRLGEERLPNR